MFRMPKKLSFTQLFTHTKEGSSMPGFPERFTRCDETVTLKKENQGSVRINIMLSAHEADTEIAAT